MKKKKKTVTNDNGLCPGAHCSPSGSLLARCHQPAGAVSVLVTSWDRVIFDLAKGHSPTLYFLSEIFIFSSGQYFPPE